jgi:hypothetical protein
MLFKVGDEVQWSKVVSLSKGANTLFGIVNAVISDSELEEWTMYEVQFGFGLFMIYGTQLKPA